MLLGHVYLLGILVFFGLSLSAYVQSPFPHSSSYLLLWLNYTLYPAFSWPVILALLVYISLRERSWVGKDFISAYFMSVEFLCQVQLFSTKRE